METKRIEILNNIKQCPVRKKWFAKLKPSEIKFIEDYVKENLELDKHSFAYKINRIYLDDPNKPKQHATIWAILTEINT